MEGNQSSLWTAMPAIVDSINLTNMTVNAKLAIMGSLENPDGTISWVTIGNGPVQDIPICFPSGGGFTVTMPIAIGDEILVVFASRCIDSWWQSGGYRNKPIEMRMHDISDGFCIPGPKSLPNTITNISSTDLQIRNNAGTTFLSIGADGRIGFQNATVSLSTLLTNLDTAVNNFMTVLAAFSGGSSPVTQTMLQVPAAAAVTALTTVATEIGALLK